MKVQLSPLLRWHIRLFQIFGFYTMSFNENPQKALITEQCLRLWSLLLLVAFNSVAAIALFTNNNILYNDDKFGFFNDVLKFAFGDLAITTIYLESIFKQNDAHQFWLVYTKLQNRQFGNQCWQRCTWQRDFQKHMRFLISFYGVLFLEILFMIIFIIFQHKNRQLVLLWCTYGPFIYTVHLCNLKFIFQIELIRLELLKLQQDLQLLVDCTQQKIFDHAFWNFEEHLRSKLLEKQYMYQQIYEMYEYFQNSCSLSIVAVLLVIYVRILVDTYFAYYSHYIG